MGQGNKKLSKRDPEANLLGYRDAGFLPEGLLNYLALLGWAIAEDRDVFTMAEMVEAFDIARGQPEPGPLRPQEGRGDQRRPHAAALGRGDHRPGAAVPAGGRVVGAAEPRRGRARRCSTAAMPLVHERMNKLTEAVDMLGFLFVDEASFTRDQADVAKLLDEAGREVVSAAHDALAALAQWSTAAIEAALRERAGRGAGAQAPRGLRAGAGGGDRSPGVAAAVRVPGAARAASASLVAVGSRGRRRPSEASAPARPAE